MFPTFLGEPAVLLVEPRQCPLRRDVIFRGRLQPFLEEILSLGQARVALHSLARDG
jgi:hypothetical protein